MRPLTKPYSLSAQEVIYILEQALSGTMDCREWDNFISIPIKGNSDMEAVRAKCEALSGFEHIEPSGIISHSEIARVEILQMLKELKSAT
ncbi:MAG: hypothetical protein Q8R74_09565 [Methylophilus sp.]|nr:hypothetical protein [Methylophilus sp.]